MILCCFRQIMAETSTSANDLVTCPVCLKFFDSARSLPCNHSFCLACIKDHCKDKTPTSKSFCPLCKQNFQVPDNGIEELPSNNHLQRLVDCRRSSCQLHSNEKKKKDLDSDELKELSRRLRGVYCEKHGEQITSSHCFDCRENVCSSCSGTDHKKHRTKTIETFAVDLKRQIEDDIKEVSTRIADIRNDSERLKTEREKFIEDVGRQETAIRQKGEEIKIMIDRKVEELLLELDNIKAESLSPALAAETRLQQAADIVQSYCDYAQEIRTKGKPHDVVRYANAIHSQATHLLENRITYADTYTSPCVMFMPADTEQFSTQQLMGYISTPLSSSGFESYV